MGSAATRGRAARGTESVGRRAARALVACAVAAACAPLARPAPASAEAGPADVAASTEVSVIPVEAPDPSALRVEATEDFCAPRHEIAAEEGASGGKLYDLRAATDGEGPHVFEWRLAAPDGTSELVQRSEARDGEDRFELSARAYELLEENAVHEFEVRATDAAGRTGAETVTVVTSPEYLERSLRARRGLPRVEGPYLHELARLVAVELYPAGDDFERLDAEASPLRAASAWRLSLAGPELPVPLHVGALDVYLPVPDAVPEGADEVQVLAVGESGAVSRTTARVLYEDGRRAAVFEAAELGEFAILADAPAAPAGKPTSRFPQLGDGILLQLLFAAAAAALAIACIAAFMRREAADEDEG